MAGVGGQELLLQEIIPSNTPKSLEQAQVSTPFWVGSRRVTTQGAGQASQNSESSRAAEAGGAGIKPEEPGQLLGPRRERADPLSMEIERPAPFEGLGAGSGSRNLGREERREGRVQD